MIWSGHTVHYVDRYGIRKKITPVIEELEPLTIYRDEISKHLLESHQNRNSIIFYYFIFRTHLVDMPEQDGK